MRQRHHKKYILSAVIAIVAIGGTVFFVKKDGQEITFLHETRPATEIYTDEQYQFSFEYPGSYNVGVFNEADENGKGYRTILIQNNEKKEGIQIAISAFDEGGSILTKQRIQKDIPGLVIKDEQPIYIGESGQGIAFVSDNSAFNGNSREVWFIFGGNFYQISTSMEQDKVLQKLLSTWTFKK